MVQVILDTNFLLLFGEHVDLFTAIEKFMKEPYTIIVLEPVLAELEKLAKKASKEGRAAKLAYALVQEAAKQQGMFDRLLYGKKKIPLKTVPSSKKHADDAIVAIAEEGDVVCTLDRALRKRLHSRVLSIKKNKLTLEV